MPRPKFPEGEAKHNNLSVRVTPDLHGKVQEIADIDGISMSALVTGWVVAAVEQRQQIPTYQEDREAVAQARVERLQAELAEAQQALGSIGLHGSVQA